MGLAAAVAAVGALLGSALPTPAYRLAVEWKTPPRDTCAGCDAGLAAGIAGWVRPGSRCPSCRARRGPAATLLAAVTAAAGAGLVLRFGPAAQLVPFLLLVPLGCLLAAIDLACLRLPEALVLPGIGGSVVAFACVAAGTGAWGALGRAVLGGLALGAVYLVLALLPGGQLGGGDVTLAALLGIYLGWLGWPLVALGGLLPFLVNAPFAVALLVARRVGRRTDLPFGPAMLAGAYLAVVGPTALAAWLTR
jgi:leader peptidase (prepilin peptidase)/N-methyltransferase